MWPWKAIKKKNVEPARFDPSKLPKDLNLCPFLQVPCIKAACHLWLEIDQTVTIEKHDSEGKVISREPGRKTVGQCSIKWIPPLLLETRDAAAKGGHHA